MFDECVLFEYDDEDSEEDDDDEEFDDDDDDEEEFDDDDDDVFQNEGEEGDGRGGNRPGVLRCGYCVKQGNVVSNPDTCSSTELSTAPRESCGSLLGPDWSVGGLRGSPLPFNSSESMCYK